MSNRLLGLLITVGVAFGLVGIFVHDGKGLRSTFLVIAVVILVGTWVAYHRSQRVKWKPTDRRDAGFGLIDTILAVVISTFLSATIVIDTGSDVAQAVVGACQSDGAVVTLGIELFQADNSALALTSPAQLTTGSTTSTSAPAGESQNGFPFLASWPSQTSHYWFGIASSASIINTSADGGSTIASSTNPAAGTTPWVPGQVYLASATGAVVTPTTGTPTTVSGVTWVPYVGPATCGPGMNNANIK